MCINLWFKVKFYFINTNIFRISLQIKIFNFKLSNIKNLTPLFRQKEKCGNCKTVTFIPSLKTIHANNFSKCTYIFKIDLRLIFVTIHMTSAKPESLRP